MRFRFTICVTCITLMLVLTNLVESARVASDDESSSNGANKMNKTVEAMKSIIGALGRQMLLQQLFLEERIRSDADSGVKQVRHTIDGTRNYHSASHTGRSAVSIHDHSNNIRTVGMGEFIGVLNGVEFRTRHNDYRLYMPHRTKKDFHAVENIPFPNVPPEVLNKNNVSEQIKEMREWFKAWKDQNHKTRDYRKYFKPVLCYLEGAWTTSTKGKVDEPFESDRHFVDASSWFDLQEKIRFTSYTGRKDNLENFSFLPTTIMNVTEEGYPQFAQWNYRIACHPLSRDLPLNRLRVVDEIGLRLSHQMTYNQHGMSRAARFQINPFDTDKWTERKNGARYGLLDELMGEIPGKDNYQGNLTDSAFDIMAFSRNPKIKEKLRAGRYHRWFEVEQVGAMGLSVRHRGYSDATVFMAMNTQPKIAGLDLTRCTGPRKNRVCKTINQKWSYAIPLEIIYLTPLNKWNPYNIQYKGDSRSTLGKTVEAGGTRNGGFSKAKAFNGIHSRKYYQTPVEFFSGGEVGSGAADTTRSSVGVLDKEGNLHKCAASGTRIFFPQIAGVGILRQRYPIMPVHGEGSSVWKELEAIKDLLMKSKTYNYIFRDEPLGGGSSSGGGGEPPKVIRYNMQLSRSNKTTPHVHVVELTPDEVDYIKAGQILVKTTEQTNGHVHRLTLQNRPGRTFYIRNCDSRDTRTTRCWDQHNRWIIRLPNQ